MEQSTVIVGNPPARSLEQRNAALERANVVRLNRARIKKELRAGAISLEQAIADEYMATASVVDLLLAVPRVGPIRASRILAKARIGNAKRVGGLTARQALELRAVIAGDELPGIWPGSFAPEHESSIEALFA